MNRPYRAYYAPSYYVTLLILMANISKSARQDLSCGSIVIVIVARGLCFGQISWGWKYYPSTNRWWSYLPEAVDTPARLIERQTTTEAAQQPPAFCFGIIDTPFCMTIDCGGDFFLFYPPFSIFSFHVSSAFFFPFIFHDTCINRAEGCIQIHNTSYRLG